MALADMSLADLQQYRPERDEPADFDEFWSETLAQARLAGAPARFDRVESHLATVEAYDVTFTGYAGQPVKAWLMLPGNAGDEPLPCVVSYVGYGGGRGRPHEHLLLASSGYAHLVMDTRGQGSAWRRGDTPDTLDCPVDPQFPGFMTRGVNSPQTYYYRRVIADAVRAVDAARSHPRIDARRIAVSGVSQGGGLALAVSGLVEDLAGVAADVPFLCGFRRALDLATTAPYTELVSYLAVQRSAVEDTYRTLSYIDGMNFAARAKAPAMISTALMDGTCPPSTIFGAYHHYAGPKEMVVWPFNGHEGGGADQELRLLDFLRTVLKG